jgi:hypothetical protein
MSDLITRLREAIDEAERIALAASPGPWSANPEQDEVIAVDGVTVADAFALSSNQTRATAAHIVATCPVRTLRMVAAHRKILDLHAPYVAVAGDPICQTCLEGSHLYAESAYPCPTLLLLSDGYGIEL